MSTDSGAINLMRHWLGCIYLRQTKHYLLQTLTFITFWLKFKVKYPIQTITAIHLTIRHKTIKATIKATSTFHSGTIFKAETMFPALPIAGYLFKTNARVNYSYMSDGIIKPTNKTHLSVAGLLISVYPFISAWLNINNILPALGKSNRACLLFANKYSFHNFEHPPLLLHLIQDGCGEIYSI